MIFQGTAVNLTNDGKVHWLSLVVWILSLQIILLVARSVDHAPEKLAVMSELEDIPFINSSAMLH